MAQRQGMEFKDASGESVQGFHPEVNAEVLKEVKTMAQNHKDIVEKLNQDMGELRKTMSDHKDGLDPLVESKVTKLQEAIITRQEAMDKLAVEQKGRIDELDIAMQRGSRSLSGGSEAEAKLFGDAMEFKKTIASMKKQKGEVREEDVDLEEYKGYCRAFNNMVRTNINQAGISPEDLKYLSVVSDVDGGILVPPTMSSRITKRVWETDPVRQLADVQTIGTDSFEERVDIDEADDGWESETVANSTTDAPKWNMIAIPTHIQSAMPKATQKILEDGTINVEAWLADKVAKRFARTEGAAFVTGTGIGRPRGFLTYSTFANSATNNYMVFGNVEYVPALDSILSASAVITCFFHLLDEYQARATWLMNRFTVMKTMLLEDGDKRPIWLPGQTALAGAGAPSTLMGSPVRMAANMPVVAANAYPMALADWGEAYTIVDRKGITVLRDPYTAKPFVLFYTRRRVGGGLRNFQAMVLLKTSAT